MASSKTTLTFLRLSALVGTSIVISMGIWGKSECHVRLQSMVIDRCSALIIIQDVDNRGDVVLKSFQSRLGNEIASWLHLIAAAAKGAALLWVLILTVSTTISLNNQPDQRRVRPLPSPSFWWSCRIDVTGYACQFSLSCSSNLRQRHPLS